MISKITKTCLVIFICLINVHCHAQESSSSILYAKVIRVVDGDTIYLKNKEHGKLKIRLADIDAPEKDQPYGDEATNILKKMIFVKDQQILSSVYAVYPDNDTGDVQYQ